MKIMFLYKYCILGGVTTQLANRLKFLTQFCEPHFAFVSEHGGSVAFEGYPHVVTLETPEQISAYINKHNFDVLVTIDTYELYEAIALSNYKGKVIHEVHTTYEQALAQLKETGNSLSMDAIVTPSYYLINIVKPFFDERYNGHFHVIENCLDTELFQPAPMSLEPKKVLLWIGKLDAHKNWPMFLDFAKAIMKDNKDEYEIWMVGGHTAADQTKQALLQRIKDDGMEHIFKWMPNVGYTEMPQIYAEVANRKGIYVSTSQNESFGMTIAEALACDCPVIVPRVGAIPEIMSNELLSQFLYEPNNVDDLVAKAENLLNNLELYQAVQNNGRNIIVTNYHINTTGEKYKHLLDQVLSK